MAIVIKFLCILLSDSFLLSTFPGIFHLTISSLRECLQNQLLRTSYSSHQDTPLLLWWITLAGNLELGHVGEKKKVFLQSGRLVSEGGTEKATLSLSGNFPCVLLSWAYIPFPSLFQQNPKQMGLLSHDFYLNKQPLCKDMGLTPMCKGIYIFWPSSH